jgi:hypothetical protein
MYMSADTPESRIEANFAGYAYDVRLYTARTLGRAGDALNAFTGLVADLKRSTMPTEFHGGSTSAAFRCRNPVEVC